MGDHLQLDYCQFGMPWRKRTLFYTNIVCLRGQTCYCLGKHEHQLLKGISPSGVLWTKVAEPYPHAVAEMLAHGVAARCDGVDSAMDLNAISEAASL